MKCPKCGYMRQNRDNAFVPATECPSCGIVYAKHDTIIAPAGSVLSASSPPHLKPSAVDPESLKKARDRVEKRLRQRLDTRIRDDRHAQTLDLARKITAEERPARDKSTDQPGTEAKPNETHGQTDQGAEAVEIQAEEALLLEEMVGVQIHSGHTDREEKAAIEKSDAEEPASEKSKANASQDQVHDPMEAQAEVQLGDADSDPQDEETAIDKSGAKEPASKEIKAKASQDQAHDPMDIQADDMPAESVPEPQLEVQANDADDVQVETVRLAPQVAKPESTSMEFTESEPTDTIDSDMVAKDGMPPAYIAAATDPTGFVTQLTRLLPVVAWIILIAGVIGAILSWTTISDVEAGVRIPVTGTPSTVPLGLLLGFAYLATGALGFAFFWVSSMISRQLKDIRQMLAENAPADDDMLDAPRN